MARIVCTGAALWFLTTIIVLLAGQFSETAVATQAAPEGDLFLRFANGDGKWYRSIAERGYQHSDGFSDTAFFPVFPVAAG